MENYILIGICLVVILTMSIQLYRTYSWQKLLDKKQSEFINKSHIKVNTKQYYAPLGMAMCCMLMVFIAPSNDMNFAGSPEVADESSNQMVAFATFDSTDDTEYKTESAVTTALGALKQPNELAETSRAEGDANDFVDIVNGACDSVKVILERVNPLAKAYSSDEIISILSNNDITITNETISDSDYLITIINDTNTSVVYALKEFENYYIICDTTYSECYYVTK